MIAFLEGRLMVAGPEAVIRVGGVGLQIQFSALAADKLPPVGEDVHVWTHLAVREDSWSLYGFLDPQERDMFRLLISVSGIGPKVAMNMLSRAPAATISRYLGSGDEKALAGLPGIGKKSAARLVIELGSRVESLPTLAGEQSSPGGGGPLLEALAVLQAMGLPAAAAESALRQARTLDPELASDLERWVRSALRHI